MEPYELNRNHLMREVIFDLIYYYPRRTRMMMGEARERERWTFRRKQTKPNVTSPMISNRLSLIINDAKTFANRQC